MAGPSELPAFLLASDGVDPLLRLAGLQIKRPRLGVERVPDDQRPDTVTDLLRPQHFAVAASQGGDAPPRELAGKKLLPIVTVQVHAEQHEHAVIVHGGRRVPEFRQVQRVLPDDLAVTLVQADHQADLGVGQRSLGQFAFGFRQLRNRHAAFGQGLLALFVRHVAGHNEHQVVPHRDGVMKDLFSVQNPALLAAVDVHGEQRVALSRASRTRAVQRLAVGGDIAPAAKIAGRRRRCAELTDRLAGFHVQQQAPVRDGDQQALAADGQIAAVVGRVGPISAGQLAPPQAQPVIDVIGHDDVFALDKQPAVEGQGAGCPDVAVGHVTGTGVAEPQQPERRLDDLVVATGGVAQVGIQVRPVAGAGQRATHELGPDSAFLNQLAARQRRLGEPALGGLDAQRRNAGGRGIRLPHQDRAAQRLDHPHQLRRVAGPLSRKQCRFGNHEIGEVIRVRQLIERPLFDAYPAAVQAGGVQGRPRGRDLLSVRRNGVDHQLGAFRQFPRQLARFTAIHQAEPALDPRLLQNRFRRPREQVAVRCAGKRILRRRLVDRRRLGGCCSSQSCRSGPCPC